MYVLKFILMYTFVFQKNMLNHSLQRNLPAPYPRIQCGCTALLGRAFKNNRTTAISVRGMGVM